MIIASPAYVAYLQREMLFPKWKLLSFNQTSDSWAEIIDGSYGQTPVDLTPYVQRIEYSYDRLSVTLSDEAALVFHPDSGALRGAIRQGRIIRLTEGFEGLAETEWVNTFSGTVEGSYTWAFQRGDNIVVQFTVFNRGNNQAWKRRNITSNSYTVGSDWGTMFANIAKDVMLLETPEVAAPEPFGVLFDKNSNQVVNYPPWDALEQLAFGVSARPWFNGKGQLDLYYTTQDRVDMVLADDKYLRRYESKGSSSETVNKVLLTYLSNELSRVDGPDQILGSATITTGFFKQHFDVDVYYSDERKTRSDNPRFIVKASANAGLLPFCTETMVKVDEFHSRIEVEVSVWAPILATVMIGLYLVQQAIPRPVVVGGLIASAGFTITLQDVLAAATLIGILLIMMCLGTGQYEIWGTPYELVYLEQTAIAQKAGIEFWEEREKEIRNDFISTLEQAQPLAVNELHYEVMKENPRVLLLRYDPRIEPGDIIQLSSTVKVYIESMARVLTRNSVDVATMTLNGYRTVM